MRMTRKSYERARAIVENAREQIKLVRAWEEAMRRIGNLNSQELVAITVHKDGSLKTECKLANCDRDSSTSSDQQE
jgi:hypothetical protein